MTSGTIAAVAVVTLLFVVLVEHLALATGRIAALLRRVGLSDPTEWTCRERGSVSAVAIRHVLLTALLSTASYLGITHLQELTLAELILPAGALIDSLVWSATFVALAVAGYVVVRVPAVAWRVALPVRDHVRPLARWVVVLLHLPTVAATEIAYRGFLLHALLDMGEPLFAVVLSAALFALPSLRRGAVALLLCLTWGVIAGMATIETFSVWPAMVGHMLVALGADLGTASAVDRSRMTLPS